MIRSHQARTLRNRIRAVSVCAAGVLFVASVMAQTTPPPTNPPANPPGNSSFKKTGTQGGPVVPGQGPMAASRYTLGVGDLAPRISTTGWVKGEKLEQFQSGKVYVIEFWASWCPNCLESIPQMTSLAKKFADRAEVIGVSTWENSPRDYDTKVPDLVKKFGASIGYSVATDAKGTMVSEWLEAAGMDEIPTVFVVNGEGRIAWVGMPRMAEMVVTQVVAGTWDIKRARAVFLRRRESEKESRDFERIRERILAPSAKALSQRNYSLAVTEFEKAMKLNPKAMRGLETAYIQLLIRTNESKAYKVAEQLLKNELKDDAEMLNLIAWAFVSGDIKLTKPDHQLFLRIAERANTLTEEKDCMIMDTYALALFNAGDIKKALAVQEEAIKYIDLDDRIDNVIRNGIMARLAQYRKAAK